MPAINPLPTPPSRNDPANFSDRADAFLAALPAYTSEANALLDDVHTSRDTVQGLRDEVMAAGLASAATNAATATTKAAEASASAAEAFGYLQTYRATSYGALANDPVVDPNGNPPTVGDEYFNTTMNLLKRFNGVTWQASDIATANLAEPGGSALVGSNDGAGGSLWTTVAGFIAFLLSSLGSSVIGFLQSGTGAVSTTVQSKLRERVSVKDFGAVCDGITDDTAAVNAAVLHLANSGGGRLMWPTGTTCKLTGTVWVVSNIDYDLNGATLEGGGVDTGVMFETAYLNAGTLVTNVGTAYQSHVIKNAKIHGGQVTDVGKLCNFQNFNMGCKVHDLELFNARQVGVFDACFYAHFDTVMHSGGTIDTIPSFHFKSANNAIKLNKVVTTVAWSYHFEGGSTAVAMIGCTQEGGTKGIKITGDCLGLTVVGNYAEAVNDWLDLSSAGDCSFDIAGNYFNYVDRVLFDGAGTSGALIGRWAESNRIVNIGQPITPGGFVYRGRMEVTGRLNLIEYELNNNNDSTTSIPANWITSGNTNISFCSTLQATGLTDYRKKALVGTGLIPLRFSGDTGTVYNGIVPFCTVTVGATTTIDTQIKWQPNSLFAKFSLQALDGNGFHELYGDIYGSLFKRHDTDPMVMTISDNVGFLRISLTQTAAPFAYVTGTVQICS